MPKKYICEYTTSCTNLLKKVVKQNNLSILIKHPPATFQYLKSLRFMIKKATLLVLFMAFAGLAPAQKKSGKTESSGSQTVETAKAEQLILQGLNQMRITAGLDTLETNEILSKAAVMQADDMAIR